MKTSLGITGTIALFAANLVHNFAVAHGYTMTDEDTLALSNEIVEGVGIAVGAWTLFQHIALKKQKDQTIANQAQSIAELKNQGAKA